MLTDLSFQDSDGIGTFPEVHERNSRISIIIFTASNDEKLGFMLQRKMFRTI
jgi:response regulator of citrate/malate metabolism